MLSGFQHTCIQIHTHTYTYNEALTTIPQQKEKINKLVNKTKIMSDFLLNILVNKGMPIGKVPHIQSLNKFINIDYRKSNSSNTERISPKHFENYRCTEFTNY